MELGGGGWSWVKVGARFNNTRLIACKICFCSEFPDIQKSRRKEEEETSKCKRFSFSSNRNNEAPIKVFQDGIKIY